MSGAALIAVAGFSGVLLGPSPAAAAPVPPPVGVPVSTDMARDEQWQLDAFDIESAWQVSTGEGVTVAVIDSGVDGSHPDLAGQVLPGIDLVANPGDPADPAADPEPVAGAGDGQNDPVGHGTTVAGLIAGRNDDSRGVVGLAPRAKILPVRVLDEENRYDDALIVAKGVRWAVDNGATVVNLSLGGTGESPALAAALDYAFARDVVVIACTGNASASSTNEVWYPAREPGMVAVAGLERDSDALWSGSITGPETVLTAPATGLLGARPGGFWRVQGTSFAAPLVAASAALVRSRWPDLPAGAVVNRLISTARDLGPAGRDAEFGFGLVNPNAALNSEVSTVERNPLDDGAAAPGVSGFGPAPGQTPPPDRAEADPEQLGAAAHGSRDGWVALPAGSPVGGRPQGFWGGGALLVAVVAGGALLARRFREVPARARQRGGRAGLSHGSTPRRPRPD
ncbi:type VII secretion-associated serine protease mycosin [Solwaraspora sp. WMMD1047]|uniref:type VII secretion-associated serine protease mycosin n=1 Tax=Solwaraspora sp. WMMD1047 TaxID=3016102 RepID=UPI0024166D85|nr:type VII secretion-associated serine protease mycosin [Solwaraspora sp. WMMD1047]MDG4828033.1 type VII secretion-associated serine protease mycosin [Solwaraspora sp. WMMD1047]